MTSDYALLTITIPIVEEHIQTKKNLIIKGSKEEKSFINDLIKAFKSINTNNLSDVELLKNVINSFTNTIERTWEKNAKIINITKYSKSWWDVNCSKDLKKYRSSRRLEDWKQFKNMVKSTKQSFFDQEIYEISNKKGGS